MGLFHSCVNRFLPGVGCVKRFFGLGNDKPMSDFSFKTMEWIMFFLDLFFGSGGKRVRKFGIKEGNVVCDYACGPGRMLPFTSELVGSTGEVYACDIHHLAIQRSKELVEKKKLKNVVVEKCQPYHVNCDDSKFDIIYALDMFHHVVDKDKFLLELCRIIKPSGTLWIEGGHMSGKKAAKLLENRDEWKVSKKHGGFHHLYELKPSE